MGTAYRQPKRTLRRKLALHRVRLTLLQRRLDRALRDLSMDCRGDVELARQRLESAIDDAPTAELEELIVAYDHALVIALEETNAVQERRSMATWQIVMAFLVVMAVVGTAL